MPWSWGRGVRVSTDEKGVLGPRELGAADVQEKMGGVARSQAQGTEQVRFPGRPGSRAPGLRTWGWWVRAGERRGQMGGQEEALRCGPPREASGFSPAPPSEPPPALPSVPPRRGPHPALPWDPHDPHSGLSQIHCLPVTFKKNRSDL